MSDEVVRECSSGSRCAPCNFVKSFQCLVARVARVNERVRSGGCRASPLALQDVSPAGWPQRRADRTVFAQNGTIRAQRERQQATARPALGLPWACPPRVDRPYRPDRLGKHGLSAPGTASSDGECRWWPGAAWRGVARRGAAWRGVAGAARAWSPGPSGDEPCRRVAEGRGGEGLAVGGGTGRYCSHRSTPRNRPPPPRHPLLRAAPRPNSCRQGKKNTVSGTNPTRFMTCNASH